MTYIQLTEKKMIRDGERKSKQESSDEYWREKEREKQRGVRRKNEITNVTNHLISSIL